MTTLKKFFNETFSREFNEEAEIKYILSEIAGRAIKMKEVSGLSYCEIAGQMGLKNPSVVRKILDAKLYDVTVDTLIRFCKACGFKIRICLEKKNDKEMCAVIEPMENYFLKEL